MKKIIACFFRTDTLFSTFLLRLTLACIFFPHGAQKVLGWFGGHGFQATMGVFTGKMQIPPLFAFLAIAAEFAGSIALLFGFFTRLAAFGLAVTMAVAVAMVHAQNGFFMNWSGKQAGEGFEFHILAIGAALALMLRGGGKWAFDRCIARLLDPPQLEEPGYEYDEELPEADELPPGEPEQRG